MIQIHFETLGCKVNQIESESAARAFADVGFSVDNHNWTAAEPIHSETILCVVNTCTVTGKAEQKARRVIKLMLNLCPNACVLVTGCYAELDSEIIKKIDARIAVLPGQQKDQLAVLPKWVKQKSNGLAASENAFTDSMFSTNLINEFINLHKADKPLLFKLSTDTFLEHSRASIKIQDGCNNSCAFCRIHLARGKSVSLDADEILHRVQRLEDAGQVEVVLTGVNVSQYKSNSFNLIKLLDYLLSNTKNISYRLSSLYPQGITDDFCNVLKNPRIRQSFHLSVQSGSDVILEKMGRPYRSAQVLEAVNKLRQVKPNAFVACDIIVGFPGETEEDFLQTVELCKKCNFTWIHVFPFSARPGTVAALMKPKVPSAIADNRVKIITQLALEQKKAYINLQKNNIFAAVIEKRSTPVTKAVTDNFLHVRIVKPSKDVLELGGKEVQVKIVDESSIKGCDADAILL